MLARVVSELAAEMGLVPLVWLVWLRFRGRQSGIAWWWLATAFVVSWLADTAALWVNPDLVGNLYPITQAALVGAVLLDRLEAAQFAVGLGLVAIVAVLWRGPLGIDVLLRTVAWGGVGGLAWQTPARVRTSLLVTFGLGLLAWWGYALDPSWPTWLLYQATRAGGIVLFCMAASDPSTRFTLARRKR